MDERIETMTLNELCRRFRQLGIATSETKIGDGIEQGKYPFGICIHQKGRQFEIYKRLVDEWVAERIALKEAADVLTP